MENGISRKYSLKFLVSSANERISYCKIRVIALGDNGDNNIYCTVQYILGSDTLFLHQRQIYFFTRRHTHISPFNHSVYQVLLK